ncbi:MAG: glycosyltransferase [Clostridia bacterium]|nr:glycosyltransferase [Clostridia bacterium]
MPKISIIIPVYNAGKYINECVDSIINQTFRDFELILVDDGSADNSGKICDDYAEKDSRIKVIHKENGGQAIARNKGLKIATGEYICFVDADDAVNPNMLEYLYEAAEKTKSKIVFCGYTETDKKPEDFDKQYELCLKTHHIDEKKLKELFAVKGCYWIVCAKIIKKEIVLKHPLPEGMVYEDNAVVCRWLYEARNITEIEAPLYFYRVNPEGTTKSVISIKRFDYLKALQMQLDFYKSVSFFDIWERISYRYFGTAVSFYKIAKEKFGETGIDKKIKKDVLKFISKNNAQLIDKDIDDSALLLLSPFRMKIKRIRRGVRRRLNIKRGNA